MACILKVKRGENGLKSVEKRFTAKSFIKA